MRRARAATLGVALLLGAAPAWAQQCDADLASALERSPAASICSELVSTSSSVSIWTLPGLASQPSVYAALLDAITRIPERDGLRGWVTAEVTATVVSPSIGPVSLLGELGALGLARVDLPARSLDYFRSDTLADSLYWSFDGINGLGVVFRSVGGGALVEIADGVRIGAVVAFLQAEALVGGHVSGGVLESFEGLDVDLNVAEFSDVRGSGTTLGILARLSRGAYRAALSLEHVGGPLRLRVTNHVREADSTFRSTEDAVDALGSTRTLAETLEVDLPTRLTVVADRRVGARTRVAVDSRLVLGRGFEDGSRVGARLLVRPAPWVQLEAGGGWSAGIDATLGIGLSAGGLTWTIRGRSALNGRDMRLATGLALR